MDFRDYFSSLDHRWLERFLEAPRVIRGDSGLAGGRGFWC